MNKILSNSWILEHYLRRFISFESKNYNFYLFYIYIWLNLDTDIYEPAVTILDTLYPRIVKGGILILDDYKVFPGETKAVNEYFKGKKIKIEKFPFSSTPHYIIKK